MMGFDSSTRVMSVDVNTTEVLMDLVDGSEAM